MVSTLQEEGRLAGSPKWLARLGLEKADLMERECSDTRLGDHEIGAAAHKVNRRLHRLQQAV